MRETFHSVQIGIFCRMHILMRGHRVNPSPKLKSAQRSCLKKKKKVVLPFPLCNTYDKWVIGFEMRVIQDCNGLENKLLSLFP